MTIQFEFPTNSVSYSFRSLVPDCVSAASVSYRFEDSNVLQHDENKTFISRSETSFLCFFSHKSIQIRTNGLFTFLMQSSERAPDSSSSTGNFASILYPQTVTNSGIFSRFRLYRSEDRQRMLFTTYRLRHTSNIIREVVINLTLRTLPSRANLLVAESSSYKVVIGQNHHPIKLQLEDFFHLSFMNDPDGNRKRQPNVYGVSTISKAKKN